ncbi:hypothetical protein CYMTET_12362 [Cymbomonas tetramitiformis]|uniref:Uncharacterized protein n=1 Tax=Cymbomonas tetramitiformis TaxID=36881 RepID=A0AAE0LCI7_9CHLO|nr:hypothetical protein CYMTET_12362 [Cymbomonas tetramitiformis]
MSQLLLNTVEIYQRKEVAKSQRANQTRATLGKEIYHEFTITFSRLGGDLPETEFHTGVNYLDSVSQWFHCVYQLGDEEGHWHAQYTGGGVGVDKTSVHTALKNALGWTGVNRSSRWNLDVKYLSYKNKVHATQGMIGYCHKNVKNFKHPVFRSKNVSEKDIQTGLDTYLLYGSSELKGRMNLARFNIFGKADLFRRFKMQRKRASFRSTLKRMIRTGKYMFYTDFILDGRGLSEERCQALWRILIMPTAPIDKDITNILFPGANSSFDRHKHFISFLSFRGFGHFC